MAVGVKTERYAGVERLLRFQRAVHISDIICFDEALIMVNNSFNHSITNRLIIIYIRLPI